MKNVCAREAEESQMPDVLVLPEGTSQRNLEIAANQYPAALVVAAVKDGQYMRAHVWWGGVNKVDFLKTLGDGRFG